MSIAVALAPSGSRRTGRSIAVIAAALVANAALALAVDQLLHVLRFYPPWGEPMRDALPNAVALGYRLAFGVLAGAMVAHLAPPAPTRHAAILGAVATAPSVASAVATAPRIAAWRVGACGARCATIAPASTPNASR